MITSNNLKDKILSEVLSLGPMLAVHGFSPPIIADDFWTTSVAFPLNQMAIEIEVDWRELVVSAFIVRLEKGKIPVGSYVSDGATCRKYLQQEILDNHWDHDEVAFSLVSSQRVTRAERANPQPYLTAKIRAYEKLISNSVKEIVSRESHVSKR